MAEEGVKGAGRALSLRGMKRKMGRRKGKRRRWGVIFEEAEGERKGRSAVLLAGRALSLRRLREEERAEEGGKDADGVLSLGGL